MKNTGRQCTLGGNLGAHLWRRNEHDRHFSLTNLVVQRVHTCCNHLVSTNRFFSLVLLSVCQDCKQRLAIKVSTKTYKWSLQTMVTNTTRQTKFRRHPVSEDIRYNTNWWLKIVHVWMTTCWSVPNFDFLDYFTKGSKLIEGQCHDKRWNENNQSGKISVLHHHH